MRPARGRGNAPLRSRRRRVAFRLESAPFSHADFGRARGWLRPSDERHAV